MTEFQWSPTNNNQLAYVQGKPAYQSDLITEEITLSIVDVVKSEILATYSGDFGVISWSSDGNKILYQDARSIFRNYGIGFTDAPCILFLNLGEKRCLRSIPRLVPAGYTLATTGIYKWGADNTSIFYTYLYQSQNDYSFLGNLCIYSLVDSHINCPTQGLQPLIGWSIGNYSLSPDQQFIHFCYSKSSILNDYADTANDAIIKIDGTRFFSWVGAIQDGGPQTCSFDTLWRPLP